MKFFLRVLLTSEFVVFAINFAVLAVRKRFCIQKRLENVFINKILIKTVTVFKLSNLLVYLLKTTFYKRIFFLFLFVPSFCVITSIFFHTNSRTHLNGNKLFVYHSPEHLLHTEVTQVHHRQYWFDLALTVIKLDHFLRWMFLNNSRLSILSKYWNYS